MKEKSHFPYILESGKPSPHEGIAAFPPPEPSLLLGPILQHPSPGPFVTHLFAASLKGLLEIASIYFSV